MGLSGLFGLVRAVASDAGRHHLEAFAGNLAYNAFLAIVPLMLFIVLALRALHADALLSSTVDLASAMLPAASAQLLDQQIQDEVISRLPDWWVFSALLAFGSLWAASAAFRAIAGALNVMYATDDDRPAWVQLGVSMLLAAAAVVLWLAVLAGVDAFAHTLGSLANAPVPTLWNALRAPMLAGAAFVASAALYAWLPCQRPRWRAIVPGAASVAVAWWIFSIGFAIVLNQFGALLVDPLYGWFTGVFALLLYLYWSAVLLLLGAEINHTLARGSS
jgi:membrane protein